MEYRYKPQGVCAREFIINVENDIIKNVKIIGGCIGNTSAISKLVADMNITEVIKKLRGISCRNGTSCPDQLAIALDKIKDEN